MLKLGMNDLTGTIMLVYFQEALYIHKNPTSNHELNQKA